MMAEDVGNRLREARKAKGLSRPTVAERMGLTRGALQHHEQGTADPSMANLAKYAKIYRVSIDWIVFGKGKGPTDAREPREAVLEVWDQIATGDQPRVLSLMQSFLPKEKDSA